MEKLTYNAKIAVIKILIEIMNADNFVHKNEISYLNEVKRLFGVDDKSSSDIDNLLTLKALSIIRELPIEQKNTIAKMMGQMIIVDQVINYNEVKLYNAFCESCNIEQDFNVDDYPEYTLSGPFVNPEDL